MHAMASKKIKRLALSICLALGSILPAGAEEFLPLSDVREGMHGYAKTVVHGTKIDTFDVDVLGIMKNKGSAGGDLVLVKVSGPLIDETGGIAQGMSGSPILQNGRLVGAVTHVLVNDPTRGYGIFAQTMLEQAKNAVQNGAEAQTAE